VAFIDDDAVADRDWLLNILKNYDTANVVGVGGLIIPLWESSRPIWFPEKRSLKGLSVNFANFSATWKWSLNSWRIFR